jgi:hypothetical protein
MHLERLDARRCKMDRMSDVDQHHCTIQTSAIYCTLDDTHFRSMVKGQGAQVLMALRLRGMTLMRGPSIHTSPPSLDPNNMQLSYPRPCTTPQILHTRQRAFTYQHVSKPPANPLRQAKAYGSARRLAHSRTYNQETQKQKSQCATEGTSTSKFHLPAPHETKRCSPTAVPNTTDTHSRTKIPAGCLRKSSTETRVYGDKGEKSHPARNHR